jgi:hypothetical protein
MLPLIVLYSQVVMIWLRGHARSLPNEEIDVVATPLLPDHQPPHQSRQESIRSLRREPHSDPPPANHL